MRGLFPFLFIFTFAALPGIGQKLDKSSFEVQLKQEMRDLFNITQMPAGYVECAYEIYDNSNRDSWDIGYESSQECLIPHIDQIQFSDRGRKMMKEMGGAFMTGCVNSNSAYQNKIDIRQYCTCQREWLIKFELGFSDIAKEDFIESDLFKKIANYCISTSIKE